MFPLVFEGTKVAFQVQNNLVQWSSESEKKLG